MVFSKFLSLTRNSKIIFAEYISMVTIFFMLQANFVLVFKYVSISFVASSVATTNWQLSGRATPHTFVLFLFSFFNVFDYLSDFSSFLCLFVILRIFPANPLFDFHVRPLLRPFRNCLLPTHHISSVI